LGFPFPYQSYAPLFTNTNDFGSQFYFVVPDNSNWFDITMEMFFFSTSNTCNPYGVVFVSLGGGYPFTGYKTIVEYQETGSPIWTVNTLSYASGNTPNTTFDSTFQTLPAGLWTPLLVFNDINITVDYFLKFTWKSVGPSNVRATTIDIG
jgi:hypothetical protein